MVVVSSRSTILHYRAVEFHLCRFDKVRGELGKQSETKRELSLRKPPKHNSRDAGHNFSTPGELAHEGFVKIGATSGFGRAKGAKSRASGACANFPEVVASRVTN